MRQRGSVVEKKPTLMPSHLSQASTNLYTFLHNLQNLERRREMLS